MSNASQKDATRLSTTARSLPIALLRVREKVMERFRPMLQRHGVTEQQWRVLRVLAETPDIDMSALAKAANLLPPSLSRMTRGLEERRLIITARAAGDGRRTSLRLSESGAALITKVAPESSAISSEIEATVGRDQIQNLIDQLETVLDALENAKA
ncbi:MAG: homoprotocatechuate degradation operon regulator HpaR [Pseudomonadota bacterium]